MCVCGSPLLIVGLAGSETSHSWPSPAHDADRQVLRHEHLDVVARLEAAVERRVVAQRLLAQVEPELPPGALTSMIEIFLCGVAHGRKSPGPVGAVMPLPSGYEET